MITLIIWIIFALLALGFIWSAGEVSARCGRDYNDMWHDHRKTRIVPPSPLRRLIDALTQEGRP